MTPPVNGNSALFLDIDGTLLDMAHAPDAVVVPDKLRNALIRLQAQLDGALAFVSGRSLTAIDHLFAPFKTAAIGCHGAELRGADGVMQELAPPIAEPVRALFRDLAQSHSGLLLEDKRYAMALHYRAAPDAYTGLMAALAERSDLLRAHGVSLIEGKSVIDARPIGIDKGVGLRALMRQEPFHGRLALFGGDDTTDLDVFHMLPEIGGTGFSVGRQFPGVEHFFATPQAVRQWLSQLADEGMAA